MKLPDAQSRGATGSDLVVIIAGCYLLVGGAVSLSGWIFDIPRLTEWLPTGGISIQPNTCIAVMAIGLGILSIRLRLSILAIIFGLTACLIALTAPFQNITGLDLGVDQLLLFDRTWGIAGTIHRGRMGLPSSFSWTVMGIAIALAGLSGLTIGRRRSVLRSITAGAGIPVLLIAMLSFIGYVFGAQDFYALPRLTVIAFQTSTFMIAAALGLIAVIHDAGIMRLFADQGPAGMMVRRVTPAIFVICAGLGFLRLVGERSGFYDAAFGTAARTIIEMVLLFILLGWTANAVRRADTRARLHERHRGFLFAIADTIRTAQSSSQLLQDIATSLGEYLGLHRCLFNEIDLDNDIERVNGDYSKTGETVSGIHKISDYSPVTSAEMMAGRTVINYDASVDTRTSEFFESVYLPSNEIAYVAVPMLRKGTWTASLWCSDDQPRDWAVDDIALMENIAERAWAAVERLRSESSLRESEDRKAFLLELSDAIRPLDDPHTIRFAAARLLAAKLGVDSVVATVSDASSTVTREKLTATSSPFVPRYDLTAGYVQEFAQVNSSSSIFFNNVADDPRLDQTQRDELTELGVAAFAGAWRNGQGQSPLAVHLHSATPRIWKPRELELLNEATDRIRTECERAEAAQAVRRSEEALRNREAELARVQRIGSVGGVYVDLTHGMLGIRSPEYRRLHGLSDDVVEETQDQWISRVHPEDREMVQQASREAIDSGAANYVSEFRIIRPGTNEVRWISAITDIERDETGTAIRMIGAHIDVTDRRRTEDALRESEERLRRVQIAGGIGSIDYDLIQDEAVCSKQFFDMLGIPIGTTIRRHVWENIIHQEDRERAVTAVDTAIAERQGIDLDFRVVRPDDGAIRWISWRAALIYDAAGAPWRYVGGKLDITDRKLAEQAAIDATVKFESVFDQSGIFAGILDLDGSLREINDLALTACGYTREEVLGKPFWETGWWHKSRQVQARIRAAAEAALAGEAFRGQLPYWQADGTERVTDFSLYPIRNAEGAIIYLHPTGIDVTEQKVAERNLLESERRSRIILESISDAFIALDRGWTFTYVNAEAGRMFDRAPGELLGTLIWNEFPGLQGSTIERVLRRTLSSGRAESITDYYPDHDRWYEFHAYPRTDGLSIYFRNVTDEKRAEEERRSVDERYRNLFGSIDQGFCTIRVLFDQKNQAADYEILEVNPAFPRVTGLKNAVGKRGSDIPRLGPEWNEIYARVVTTGKPERLEHYVPGVDRWFNVYAYRVEEPGDNKVAVLFEDITERKASELERRRAAEALAESETRYRLAQKTGSVGIWDWDIREGRTYWSEQMWLLYDHDEPVSEPNIEFWSAKIHSDDRERAIRLFNENLQSNLSEHNDSYRVECRDGSVRWLESIATIERAADGQPVRMYGVNLDVTELRAANDELENRVAARTQELATANLRLVEQMEAQATFEAQRIELLKRIFTVQEEERGRIARDLHDQLGQRLTALRLKIASLTELCSGHDLISERVERLGSISEMLDKEVSFLVWELRPAVLDKSEFVSALQQYVTEWSRHAEIFAEFEAIGMDDLEMHPDVENNFYRITQEALNNVAKYADATKVNVLIERRSDQLLLIIEDDGNGFDVGKLEGDGFGLISMRERASLVSGELEIESTPGAGTTLFVKVPLAF